MAPLPPLPIAKPGRVRVLQAVANYVPAEGKIDEIAVDEGNIIYVTEITGNCDFYSGKCGEKMGKIPCSYINNQECVTSIEFPLHEAAKRGNFSFLQECLQNKVSVNALDRSGSTVLYWSSHAGHADIVTFLLTIPNISISPQNKLGDTPLHAAAWKNRLECVKLLVEAGASPHIKNNDLKKPIDMTTNPEIAAILKITMSNCVENPENYEDYSSSEETEA